MSTENTETKKRWFAKKLMSKEAWRWRSVMNSGLRFRWKRLHMIKFNFVNDFLFKIVSFFEAVFLGSTLCFFFLCCGCHF